MAHAVPPGFTRCTVCGEYDGTTLAKHLSHAGELCPYDPERRVTVLCRCRGPLCSRCCVNHIHGPISETYDPISNKTRHRPWFEDFQVCGAGQSG